MYLKTRRRGEFREREYPDTVKASTVVPPELRAMLYDMKRSPKTQEEEVWGELAEDRINRASQTKGMRDLTEAQVAIREFSREYCRNRGIEHPTMGLLEELRELRAYKRLNPPEKQGRVAYRRARYGSWRIFLFSATAAFIGWRARNRMFRAESETEFRRTELTAQKSETESKLEALRTGLASPELAADLGKLSRSCTKDDSKGSVNDDAKADQVRELLSSLFAKS
ncbi:hypothetical protein NDN08_004638 [Rhodosorus marinus]|uniref:Uncharacterized protein n=1 Tax=Rhodosorus marinus TaxID=101924 RepID=A0AAV8UQZ9_9RHOD|nr:hypothetical protein NDN08_004638 [Rhodosorus marinus]